MEGSDKDKTNTDTKGGRSHSPAKRESYMKNAALSLSTPAKYPWGKDSLIRMEVVENEGKEDSFEESEESDNYSLGINRDTNSYSQEGESSKEVTDIRLMQCPMGLCKGINKEILANKAATKVLAKLSMEETLSGCEELVLPMETETKRSTELNLPCDQSNNVSSTKGEVTSGDTVVEMNNPTQKEPEDTENLRKKGDLNKLVTREGRRTSSRLKNDILLTTEDKNLRMGKKRNLEGTNLILKTPSPF